MKIQLPLRESASPLRESASPLRESASPLRLPDPMSVGVK